jgi:hypothetical protein
MDAHGISVRAVIEGHIGETLYEKKARKRRLYRAKYGVRERMCLRKQVYESEHEANEVARHMRRTAHTYECPFCGHWHVGGLRDNVD